MPLVTFPHSGIVAHIAPDLYHAELVPSRRRALEHYNRVVNSLSKKQRNELEDSLALIRRLLPIN